jgi:hypothetical protein
MRYFLAIFVFTIVAVVSLAGLRGSKSSRNPLYIFPDMEYQTKYAPQGENDFSGFSDHRDDRPVVPGTIQRGYGWALAETFSPDFKYAPAENPALYSGRDKDGNFLKTFPVHVTDAFIELGRQKFNINCVVCHGLTGNGEGITKMHYGMGTVRNLLEAYVINQPEGQIFTTITYGHGKMGSYGERITPEERWAIVAYVRALEIAGNATPDDVTEAPERAKLGL